MRCRLAGPHSHQYLSTTDNRSSIRTDTHTQAPIHLYPFADEFIQGFRISTLPLQPVVKIKHVTVDADVVQVGSPSLELSHQEDGFLFIPPTKSLGIHVFQQSTPALGVTKLVAIVGAAVATKIISSFSFSGEQLLPDIEPNALRQNLRWHTIFHSNLSLCARNGASIQKEGRPASKITQFYYRKPRQNLLREMGGWGHPIADKMG